MQKCVYVDHEPSRHTVCILPGAEAEQCGYTAQCVYPPQVQGNFCLLKLFWTEALADLTNYL